MASAVAAPAPRSLLVTALTPHVTPTRLVDLAMGAEPSREDVASLVATVRAYWTLTHNLEVLRDRGAEIVELSGDSIELDPERIELRLTDEAERAEMRANEDYYGGDGAGSYGPSDPRFT